MQKPARFILPGLGGSTLPLSGTSTPSAPPPRIVVHTGLTYAYDTTAAGPLLRDHMKNVAWNSLKTYVQKTYVPPGGYHFEFNVPESPSGLGHFAVANAAGKKVQIEYVYP